MKMKSEDSEPKHACQQQPTKFLEMGWITVHQFYKTEQCSCYLAEAEVVSDSDQARTRLGPADALGKCIAETLGPADKVG